MWGSMTPPNPESRSSVPNEVAPDVGRRLRHVRSVDGSLCQLVDRPLSKGGHGLLVCG